MKRILTITGILIIAAAVYSFVPVVGLYLQKDPAPYTNSKAVEKLKPNKGNHFEFIVFSDNHSGLIFSDSVTLKIVRSINREGRFKKIPIDFVIAAGDLTFRGRPWEYKIYNRIRSMIKIPVISAMGNHDEDQDDGSLYKKYTGEKDVAFANRNSYFIVVDNSTGDLDQARLMKLEEELIKSSVYAHRFIILHKPPISPYFQSWYRPEGNAWSYRFMKLCETYKVDMVFSGHEHMLMDKTFGGVRYIVTGGGGMLQNLPDSAGGFLHYMVVRVYGDYVDYEVRKIFPPAWEFFVFYIWKDAFYFLKNALA